MNGHSYYFVKILKHLYKDDETILRSDAHGVTQIDNLVFDAGGMVMERSEIYHIALDENDSQTEMILCPFDKDERDEDEKRCVFLADAIKQNSLQEQGRRLH